MNDCTKVRGFLNRYFKDELDKKKRLYVETHVKSCIMCSAEMEFAKKRASVSELLVSLKPQQSLFKRIANAPHKIKIRFKKAFLKRPVVLPFSLAIMLLFIPFGIYAKKNNFFRHTEEIKQAAQTAQEIEKSAVPQEIQQKPSSVNPIQSKQEKKDEKPEVKKQEIKKIEPKKEPKKEQKPISAAAETVKKEETAEKKADIAAAKTDVPAEPKKQEQTPKPSMYRLAIKSDMQPDAVLAKIAFISENLNASVMSSKGFSTAEIDNKKEILIKLFKNRYDDFLTEMKNQFMDVSSESDKNIRLPEDISKQEDQTFVLVELN